MTMIAAETNAHTRNSTRILLVDDCDVNRFVAQQYLERAGYEVGIAETGRQAVEAHKRKSYDLILMDLVMPGMDGYEVTRQIREFEIQNPKSKIRSVPIIAMSGHAAEKVAAECEAAGMNDCIGKPLQREPLVLMVQKWTACGSELQNTKKAQKAACLPARSPIDDQVPIEIEKTIKEFMGKTDILLDVIKTFRDKVKTQIVSIRQHISDKDYKQIFLEAHSIKGGAGNLRAFKLSNTAAELENAAIEAALEETVARVDELEEEFNRLNKYIEQTVLPQLNKKAQLDM